MTSGQSLGTNRNDLLPNGNTAKEFVARVLRGLIVCLLAVTGFIHWYLPVVHKAEMPGALTEGIVSIPHDLLHLLFDLNGVGYFILVACVAGWLPLWTQQQKRLYILTASYAALTIIAWIMLSDPAERGVLDYIDKSIELLIVVLAVWLIR